MPIDDKALLAAISAHESNDNPNAVGKSGEIGKYQFMPNTIKQLGGDARKLKGNADLQDQLALKHLQSLKATFGDDQDKIIAAWNAGPTGVKNAVEQGGADWQKFLPKGTNKSGAAYDTGAYLTKVRDRLGPQVAQSPQVEPPVTPSTPSPRSPMGAEQRIAQAYTKGKQVDIEKWAEEYAGQAQAAQPAAKPEQKPQEAGGFFQSAGSAFKAAGSAIGSAGKMAADAIYPPTPVEGAGPIRRAVEKGVETMAGGVDQVGQAIEGGQKDVTIGGVTIPGQVVRAATGAMGALNATPAGGLMGAAGSGAKDLSAGIEAAAPSMDDEQLKARIDQLKSVTPQAMAIAGVQAQEQQQEEIKRLEALLMMPYDERVKKTAEEAGQAGELVAGALPMPLMLGAGKLVGKAGGAFNEAQAAAKAGRIEAVSRAGEEAITAGAKPANAAQKLETLRQSPEAAKAIEETVPAAASVPKQTPIARVVEDVTYNGESKRALLGPNDNMVVALDAEGKDLGYLWYTRENGGYTVRKIEVAKEAQRKGVATELDRMVSEVEGPYLGSTDKTAEGTAFRAAREKAAKPQPAEMGMYQDARELMQGDLDLAETLLKDRGYKMPDFGLKENADIHQALDLAAGAAPRQKAWAQEAAIGVAHDMGLAPEAAVEALPAVGKIIKGLSESDAKALREVVEAGVKDADSPLSALRSSALVGAGQEGKVNAGMLFVLGRAALGGALGAMTGEDSETSVRNALLAAGVSSVLSPKLAKNIVTNLNDPAIRDSLKKTLMLHGETGSINLRFPSRGVGKNPSPNTANMGVEPPAKALVRGINEKLQKLDLLDRAKVQTHEMTIEGARRSQYNSVEKVLSLDSAKLSLEELPAAGLAARNMRDFVAEDVIQTAARAKLNPGDAALADEVVQKVALTGKLSQQVTNMETAYARATNALGIMTDTTMASKFDLGKFAGDLEAFKGALTSEGKVSPTQLVEMITNLADKAAAAKIATVASKWPEALWNIYYGLNLLASPLTHARNVIGNTGALGMAVLDRAGGELLGPLYRLAGAKNTVARGETYDMVAAMYEIVSDSFRAGSDKMGAFGYFNEARKTGKSAFGASKYTEALNVAQEAMDSGRGTLPWVVQTMSTLGAKNMGVMTGVDEFFKVLSFQAEMRALARRNSQHLSGKARSAEFMRLMDEPTTDMLHSATEFAKENTFTKAFKPGTDGGWRTVWGLGAQVEGAANNPFMKVLATPFYRTPMRIGEFSTVHTPVLNALAPQFWSDMAAGGVKQQLAIAKVMTGTAIMGSMAWYAAHGYITGAAPSDPQLRKKMELAGWQEKSIYNPVNGKYYSYDNIEPLSTIVGTIATFIQAAPDMDDHSIQTIFSAGTLALGKNILNKQWFTGLQDLSEALQAMFQGEDAGAMLKFASRRAATMIPGASAFRTVQNATDPVKRDTQTVKDNENPELREFEKLVHIFAQSTPGWGGRNALELAGYKPRPAAINGITGEVLPNENQWIGLVNPFRVTSLKNDSVLNELVALDGAGLPQELIPRVLGGSQAGSPFKLQGDEMREIKEGVKLSEEERHRLAVLMTREVVDYNGDTMHEAMAREIQTEEYKDEKDGRSGGKAYRLASIYHQFLAEAADKLRDEYPAIDIAIQRRQVERDGGRMPKSLDWLQDSAREMAGQRMR